MKTIMMMTAVVSIMVQALWWVECRVLEFRVQGLNLGLRPRGLKVFRVARPEPIKRVL